jgi:hypothetical protein
MLLFALSFFHNAGVVTQGRMIGSWWSKKSVATFRIAFYMTTFISPWPEHLKVELLRVGFLFAKQGKFDPSLFYITLTHYIDPLGVGVKLAPRG